MVKALALILSLQLVGELIVEALGAPIPGPVVGMALLFLGLWAWGGVTPGLETVSKGFLDNLGLFFVPAGVGVSLHLSRAGAEWPALLAAVAPATLISMVAVAWAFRLVARLAGGADRDG